MRWLVLVALVACGDPPPQGMRTGFSDKLADGSHATRVRTCTFPVPNQHEQQLVDLRMIERSVLAGRVDEVKTLAYLFAQPPPAWMAPWPEASEHVTAAARSLATSPDLGAACRRTPLLATACAGCHVEAHVAPNLVTPARPSDDVTFASRAAIHRWAIDRLWDGMIGASDSPWQLGLAALAEVPAPDAIGGEDLMLAQHLQRVARDQLGAPASDVASRGEAYGELLASCTGCHVAKRPRLATRAAR